MQEKRKAEVFGVLSFWIGVFSYLLFRAFLVPPVVGLILSVIGLIRYDEEKNKEKWYAVAGLVINLASILLGIRDWAES